MPPASKLPPAETPSSDQESSDDEESSESSPPFKSPLKKAPPPPPPPSQPQHQPSSDETDDSDSEHGSPQKPQPISSQRNHPKSIPPALTKSTASKRPPDKPPEKDSKLNKKKKLLVPEVSETERQQPKHKKNKATTAAGTGTVSEEHVQKKKKAVSASAAATSPAVSEEESEKKLFQPIWSGEDQIELLKGMISFKKQGKELQYNWEEFFDSMKGKVHFDASLPQVQNKVRSLRKKFFNNFAKENKNKGHSPSFRNVLEENAYQLSKKIWGGGAGVNDNANGEERGQGKNDGDKGKSIKTSNDLMTSPKKIKEMSLLEGAGPNVDSQEKDDLDDYPCLSVLTNGGGFEFGQMLPFMQAPSKKGLIRLDSEKRKEFEGRWRKLFDRKTDLVFDELQLAKEMNKAVWDVMQDVE